jgi:hypothetical protein
MDFTTQQRHIRPTQLGDQRLLRPTPRERQKLQQAEIRLFLRVRKVLNFSYQGSINELDA